MRLKRENMCSVMTWYEVIYMPSIYEFVNNYYNKNNWISEQ